MAGVDGCTFEATAMWPDKENVKKTLTKCFQAEYGARVVVIMDCFEVFIEWPSNILARSGTWSNYKPHNTVKLLIGIAPQGVVSFISAEAWGGVFTRGCCSCRLRFLISQTQLACSKPGFTFQRSLKGNRNYWLWK